MKFAKIAAMALLAIGVQAQAATTIVSSANSQASSLSSAASTVMVVASSARSQASAATSSPGSASTGGASSTPDRSNDGRALGIGVGVGVGCALLFLGVGAWFLIRRRRRRARDAKLVIDTIQPPAYDGYYDPGTVGRHELAHTQSLHRTELSAPKETSFPKELGASQEKPLADEKEGKRLELPAEQVEIQNDRSPVSPITAEFPDRK